MPIRLDDAFDDDARRTLSELGYTTLDAALGAANAVPNLARLVGIDLEEVRTRHPEAAFPLRTASESRSFALGARMTNIPPVRHAYELVPPTLTLPPSVDLIPQLPPIRNQERRGTCVAFATLAVLEHRLRAEGNVQDMSEQFQYWNCKRNDGDSTNPGTFVSVSFPLLVGDGCCREATWAYVPDDVPGNEGQNPPPAGAISEAAGFRRAGVKAIPPTSVRALKAELARGRCVAFSVPVFDSWYLNEAVVRSGDIVMPFPNEPFVGGHAMCLVGYQDSDAPGNPGGGRFILRNSWGAAWGAHSRHGAGYGTIPYAYLDQHGKEAYTIS